MKYLYGVKSSLLNVRLDEARLKKVEVLRAHGTTLSELVRQAIDERYEQTVRRSKPLDVDAIFAKLDALYPLTEKDLPRRSYNVHDRKQAAAYIREHLQRKHRRGGAA